MAQGKTWELTLNNYEEADIECLDRWEVRRIIVSKEVEDEGTPHLQGKITFTRNYRLAALKKLHPRVHWELSRATDEWNYVMKSGSEVVIDKNNRKQGARSDLEAVHESIKKAKTMRQVANDHPVEFMKYPNGIAKLHAFNEERRTKKPAVTWLYGDTSTGKTSSVFKRHPDIEIWTAPSDFKFWNGYEQQEVILIDDFREERLAFDELLRVLDAYPMTVNVKNGHRELNSPFIYITSIVEPRHVYTKLKASEPIEQLMRRIDNIVPTFFDADYKSD